MSQIEISVVESSNNLFHDEKQTNIVNLGRLKYYLFVEIDPFS